MMDTEIKGMSNIVFKCLQKAGDLKTVCEMGFGKMLCTYKIEVMEEEEVRVYAFGDLPG